MKGTCYIEGCLKPRTRRGLCQMHAWRLKHYGDPMRERQPRAKCSIGTCERTVKGHGLCPLHLRRKKRGIPFDYSRPQLNPKRYRLKKIPGHPLADRLGRVYVHRAVLFESIKWMVVPCFWCGCPISFSARTILADHLNHDRHDNRLQNLVPACDSCNAGRTRSNSHIRHSIYENFILEAT